MKNRKPWSPLAAAAALVACGGGGDPETTAGIDARGAPARVGIAAQGAVSGFGSIIVNGVRYDTSNATFDVDGQPGSENDLAVGQVVTITGSTDDNGNDARAERVSYDNLVVGPVEFVDVGAATITVLGQSVRVNRDTIFADAFVPAGIEGVAAGQVIEVSGFVDSTGAALATYIELVESPTAFELTGNVSQLDSANFTFTINGLVIDFSNANLEDFPSGTPENGQTVEAEGSLGSNAELVATSVRFKDIGLDAEAGESVEIEGLITRFVSASDFDVGGIAVTTTANTTFDDGTAADLALDVLVEVEGELDTNGVVVAQSIDFEGEATLELRGRIEATTANSITLLGVTASVSIDTYFVDQSSAGLERFGVGDLAVGDYVEVIGSGAAGALALTGVERKDDPGESAVYGPVSALNAPDFSVVGVTVRTTAATTFEDADDNSIDAAEFFATAAGKAVDVQGAYASGVLEAEDVEIDESDAADDDD
ncbi:MAG: DUF5666 domain-containing protein [Woeseiaceae bacterium]|jgi:hypothetical protein|nr:DUF5666 domain-containing protein [Woeseiaceae bacterium]